MGFTLPIGLQERVQRFDPTVEILWNNRIKRWVVACVGGGMHSVHPALLGVLRITGEKTHFTPIFVCEMDPPGSETTKVPPGKGVPVVPGDWIIGKLHQLRDHKHRTPEQYDRQVAQEEADQKRARDAAIANVGESLSSELLRHGKKGDDLRAPRSVSIEGNPLHIT